MIDDCSTTDRELKLAEFRLFTASSIKEQINFIPDFGEPRVGATLPRGNEPNSSCEPD